MTADNLLVRLEHVKRTGASCWIARCPAHGDKTPSLSIRETDDGRILLHDFGGCSVESVLGALGLDFDALFPERPTEDNARKRILKPWRASDVVRALGFEFEVAWIILADVSKGKSFSDIDRRRAAECAVRLQRFSQELDHAY